jgi:tRNA-dihydrouridine synthase A
LLPIIAIAPMINYTDRHYRFLMRLISKHTRLYTEMLATGMLLHGNRERLAFSAEEHPVALQLGGSHPQELALCAKIAEDFGYDEVNLNIGCPSSRVQAGRFGACLMKEPQLVAECVAAMSDKVGIPVTVKTRIGVDDHDSYEKLHHFITTVAAAGCQTFIMHARKAWLKGLSPRENREIPPLQYETVYRLKRDFPHLTFILNGGVKTICDIETHLKSVDGVMIGREAYANPYFFANIDAHFFGETSVFPERKEIVMKYFPYLMQQFTLGAPMHHLVRHTLNLFHGQPRSRHWRKMLSDDLRLQPDKQQFVFDLFQGVELS